MPRTRAGTNKFPVLLQGALRLDPDFAMAHMRLGQYYSALVGKNQKALAELDRAYQLRPGVTGREQRRIEAAYYGLQERYDEKAESLRVLVSLYPDDEEAHQELASAYYDLGRLDQAVLELGEVLRLNPHSASAYGNLVLYLARSNKADAAITAAGEASRQGLASPRMHWGLGLAYLGQGNLAAARQEFEQIGGTGGIDRELQDLSLDIADLYEGKLEAARAELVRQIQAVPAQSGGLQLFRRYLVGRIYLIQNNWRAAELQADLMLQVPSTELQASDLLGAGTLYARAGKVDKARQVVRRLDESRKSIQSSSNLENFHSLEGEILLAETKTAQAAISFAAAGEGFAPFIASTGLARAYQEQRRWDLSSSAWEKVISQRNEILQSGFPPDLVVAHLEAARAYIQMNNRDLALKHYQEIVRMWPHGDDLSILRQARHELQDLKPKVGPFNRNLGSAAPGPLYHSNPTGGTYGFTHHFDRKRRRGPWIS